MIRRVDKAVDDLLQLLRDLKIDNNTLVVFTSDNGPHHEQHDPRFFESFGEMDGTKRDLWEAGIRVPAMAWWPGQIPAGTSSSISSGIWDWLPTFSEAAKMPVPAYTDGISLMPSLTQQNPSQTRDYLYFEYYHSSSTQAYDEFEPAKRGRTRIDASHQNWRF
jgi:arylsulfatase A-like enzyme